MTIDPIHIVDIADVYIKELIEYSPRIIEALIILIIGLFAIRIINRSIRKVMIKRELNPTITKFLADILLWGLRVILFVTVTEKLGILKESTIVAVLGAMGLAIGLSLQGSLSNFAGGLLIIMFKPFKVGDTI